jgi:heme oxygenase
MSHVTARALHPSAPVLLLARLEHETRAFHHEAEQPWLSLVSPALTRSRYGAQLARAYGFAEPLENALSSMRSLTFSITARAHARLIAHDLFALDYGALRSLPKCEIPTLTTVGSAAGWLYAIERSARLYPMIAGHVRERLPHLTNACTYLDDPRAEQRWKHIGIALEHLAQTSMMAAEIVESAHAAFRALTAWYAEPVALRRAI